MPRARGAGCAAGAREQSCARRPSGVVRARGFGFASARGARELHGRLAPERDAVSGRVRNWLRTQLGRANAAAQEKANLMKGVNEDEKKIAQSIERVAMSQAMAAQKIAKRAEKASEEAEKETATSGDLRTQVTQISERVDHIGEKLEKYNEIVGKQTEREGAIKDLKESGDNSVATVCVASFFILAAEGSGVGHTPRNLEL